MSDIETKERNDISPLCPHCERELAEVCYRRLWTVFGKCYIYFCEHCRKTLGVTHRKGLWTN